MKWHELQESKALGVHFGDADGSVSIPIGATVFEADGETTLDRRVTYSFDEPVQPMGLAQADPSSCASRATANRSLFEIE